MSCCICSLPARGALCGHCAADPDATARHICDVLALCEQTHTRLLADLSADDTRRFLNVKRARAQQPQRERLTHSTGGMPKRWRAGYAFRYAQRRRHAE